MKFQKENAQDVAKSEFERWRSSEHLTIMDALHATAEKVYDRLKAVSDEALGIAEMTCKRQEQEIHNLEKKIDARRPKQPSFPPPDAPDPGEGYSLNEGIWYRRKIEVPAPDPLEGLLFQLEGSLGVLNLAVRILIERELERSRNK